MRVPRALIAAAFKSATARLLATFLIASVCCVHWTNGASVTCEVRENENFQIENDACYITALITLAKNERLEFIVTNVPTTNITAVIFSPPGQLQLNITYVPREIFDTFPQLHKLELRASIEQIVASDFERAHNLRQLTLNNQLEVVTRRVFVHARNLTSIILSRNRIYRIEDYAFDGLDHLEQLMLGKNRLTTLTRLTFAGLPKLNFLNLRDNELTTIEDGAFALPSLVEITLSKNRLKTLSDYIFDGAPLLRNIAIDNNGLEQIGRSMYRLQNAARIVLYQNKIQDLDVIEFSKLPELTTLWLRDSGFNFGNKSLDQFQAANSKVTYLDISYNRLSDRNDLKRIAIFRQLKTLILDDNEYTELSLDNGTIRQQFPDLETIHLSRNKWNCQWLSPVLEQLIKDHIRAVPLKCE